MVEAAIVLPVVILAVMLLLRTFVFYFEILDAGVNEHIKAAEAWDNAGGAGLKSYSTTREIKMFRGGLLHRNLTKRIDVKAYMMNEDLMVRAGEAFGND